MCFCSNPIFFPTWLVKLTGTFARTSVTGTSLMDCQRIQWSIDMYQQYWKSMINRPSKFEHSQLNCSLISTALFGHDHAMSIISRLWAGHVVLYHSLVSTGNKHHQHHQWISYYPSWSSTRTKAFGAWAFEKLQISLSRSPWLVKLYPFALLLAYTNISKYICAYVYRCVHV